MEEFERYGRVFAIHIKMICGNVKNVFDCRILLKQGDNKERYCNDATKELFS